MYRYFLCAMGLVGFGLIVHEAGWAVGGGVFLAMWANNVGQALNREGEDGR